jgi:hypothetical protein
MTLKSAKMNFRKPQLFTYPQLKVGIIRRGGSESLAIGFRLLLKDSCVQYINAELWKLGHTFIRGESVFIALLQVNRAYWEIFK